MAASMFRVIVGGRVVLSRCYSPAVAAVLARSPAVVTSLRQSSSHGGPVVDPQKGKVGKNDTHRTWRYRLYIVWYTLFVHPP